VSLILLIATVVLILGQLGVFSAIRSKLRGNKLADALGTSSTKE
jgi:hypothetical protein